VIWPPIRVQAPVQRPVTLDAAREQCRVTHLAHDNVLLEHLDAAISALDGWNGILGRCLIDQVWRVRFDGWSSALSVAMPGGSAAVLRYLDQDLTEQTVDPGAWRLLSDDRSTTVWLRPEFVAPAVADVPGAIWVDFTLGYGAEGAAVPAALRAAIRMHVSALYDGLPDEEWRSHYLALIAPHRVTGV